MLPFRLEPGLVVDRVVSNVDVWPTILDLVGLPPLQGADGVSLVPNILAAAGRAPAPDGARMLFSQIDRRWGRPSEEPDPFVAITEDALRLMMRVEDPGAARLYDLAVDPLEAQNVAAERPEAVAPLREAASAYAAGGKSPWGVDPDEVELDAMRLDQLRALGYVIQ